MRCKRRQKLFDYANRSAADVLKTLLKRLIQKSANTARDLIGYKIVNRITKVSKNLQQNR